MEDLKWLMGSDFHIPFADRRAMDIWFRVLKEWKPDVVDYVGDIDDMACVSRFDEGSANEVLGRLSTYTHETRAFYAATREILPNAEIVVHGGNHEARAWAYVSKKAPALLDLITPESLWGLDSLGIKYHRYSRPPVPRYGDLFVHHGMYAPQDSGKAVAKTMDKFHISIVQGHTHRQGAVFQSYPLAEQQDLRGYELGHMADIESPGMEYDWQHDWQQGFGLARVDYRGYPHVSLVGINRDYRAYVEGRLIEG